MNLAYIIIGHKNFGQIRRLIRRLDDEQSRFVVIIDSRAPAAEFSAFKQSLASHPHITFIPRPKVQWGNISLTLANRAGIQLFLQQTDFKFDYVFSVSGQDYPLMSPDDIRATLAAGNGSSFLLHEAFPVSRWDAGSMGRMFSWNFVYNREPYQFPKWAPASRLWARWIYAVINRVIPPRGPFPLNIHPFGGSTHWILSREAAEFVIRFTAGHPDYDRRFRYTLHSDEVYFQTILANSVLRDRMINTDLRYLRWPTPGAASPMVLTQANLPEILASGAVLARKFDVTVDEKILDLIDQAVDTKNQSSTCRSKADLQDMSQLPAGSNIGSRRNPSPQRVFTQI